MYIYLIYIVRIDDLLVTTVRKYRISNDTCMMNEKFWSAISVVIWEISL